MYVGMREVVWEYRSVLIAVKVKVYKEREVRFLTMVQTV